MSFTRILTLQLLNESLDLMRLNNRFLEPVIFCGYVMEKSDALSWLEKFKKVENGQIQS